MLATLEDVVTAELSAIPHADTGQSQDVHGTELGHEQDIGLDIPWTEWKTFEDLAETVRYDGQPSSLRKMLWSRQPCCLSQRLPSNAVQSGRINPLYWQNFIALYGADDRKTKAEQIEEYWKQRQGPIQAETVDVSSALAEFRGGGLDWRDVPPTDLSEVIDGLVLGVGDAICDRIADDIGVVVEARLGKKVEARINQATKKVLGGGNG